MSINAQLLICKFAVFTFYLFLLDFYWWLAWLAWLDGSQFAKTPLNKSWLRLESETAHSMWKQHTGMSSNEEQQFNLIRLVKLYHALY